MKKHNILCIICILALVVPGISAQVSHGGEPLPLSALRSSDDIPFIEMPGFDVEEELRLDSLEGSCLRGGFRFAYKFITDIRRGNSGTSFILPDGTRVWRVGIYSPGALSINVLFSEYELPKGAQLFLYDENQQHILGAFTHQNNSELEVLPVAPVRGDRLIIEYQEPSGAEFPGRLAIGEVNHAYRSLSGQEPREGVTSIDGIPALCCYADSSSQTQTLGQSVVLMIINGTTACTGTLLNNTALDGKPYLLTASHCLNNSFSLENPDYEEIAGSIVCFYNYNSPLCDPILRGTEELSTASAHSCAVCEFTDMALLELLELPPVYYQPYLAGWNAGGKGNAPYQCIQHPQYSTKRISISENELTAYSLSDVMISFYPQAHWLVDEWSVGYTADGSSGAPLFDKTGKVVGALSGGQSTQGSPYNDYFYSLQKSWNLLDDEDQQLECWLSPNGSDTSCEGMDPYASTPCVRLSNVQDSGKKSSIEMAEENSEPVFGNNSSGVAEYAEAYTITGSTQLYGVYIVTPSCGTTSPDVEITVYDGDDTPSTLLYTETFKPVYLSYSSDESFVETAKDLNRAQESFVVFSSPVTVSEKFYVGYRITQSSDDGYFAAYNLPKGSVSGNTAWILNGNEWQPANEYSKAGYSTSLFVDPVVNYQRTTSTEEVSIDNDIQIFQSRDRQWLYIRLNQETTSGNGIYRIYSANGKLVKNGTLEGQQTSVSLDDLSSGIYIAQISAGNILSNQKIIR